MKSEVISVRFKENLLDLIDAARGDMSRADYVRALVMRDIKPPKPTPRQADTRAWSVVDERPRRLLALVSRRRLTPRAAERELAWTPGLYRKIETELMNAGILKIEGGILVAA